MTTCSFRSVGRFTAILSLTVFGGCGTGFVNSTASLGGEGAGSRGSLSVVVINNTSQTAALVLGTFDQGDPSFSPDAIQIGLDDLGLTLGPESQVDAISFQCGRVFSVGSRSLLDLVETSFDAEDIETLAFVEGAAFFDVTSDGTSDPALVGTASALEALLGLDFNCGSILIVRLEVDEVGVGAFRIDFELIPSRSGR